MTAERAPNTRLATAVFLALVVATVGAFFVTQRLKRGTPVVVKIHLQPYFSPNGDGRLDRAALGFKLPKASDSVTVSVADASGDEVRRLADRRLSKGRHTFYWNGRDNSGRVAPDGFYYLRVILNGEGRGSFSRDGTQLITRKPRAKLLSVDPSDVPPGGRQAVTIHFKGPSKPAAPLISVYRTDPRRARLVWRFNAPAGSQSAVWNGRIAGRPAPPGTYAFGVTVQNLAGVAGSSPRKLPPTLRSATPHTGMTVAGIEAAPPLDPVRAGTTAAITVAHTTGRVRWTLTRAGASRPLRRGAGVPATVFVPIPRKATTGLYVVRLRSARGGSAAAPLAVRGRRPGRVLVVLPAITWQGLNAGDYDDDGFPDTLDNAPYVPLGASLARGRLPAGVTTSIEPLLRFLDANRLPYDLTTDDRLARDLGPKFDHRPAVVFAADERWFTEPLDARLRAYVERGGRVASFGTDSFRRTVRRTPTRLESPSPPQATNALGERTAPAASAAAPLVVNPGDALGLFAGTDGFIGLFTRFEQSRDRVSGANLEASAGRDPNHPALVAYKLGRGLVFRAGTPQWSASLSNDPEVARVTTNLWSLLSR